MEKTSERTNVTVSIKDMILYLCSKWRVLIIWLIIGAIIGGAYSAFKSLESADTADYENYAASIFEKMSDTDLSII